MRENGNTKTREISQELRERIEELQLSYIHSIDDGPLEEWPEHFTKKCLYIIIAKDNVDRGQHLGVMRFNSAAMLKDRATATQHAAVFAPRIVRHVIGRGQIVSIEDDAIYTRTNVAVYQTSPDGDTMLLVAGQYRDKIVTLNDELKFAEKQMVYDTFRLPDSIVYPL